MNSMKGTIACIAAVILLLAAAVYLPRTLSSGPSGERSPSTTLKTISSAQADFRANDRDGDGVQQFWRGDIAGLNALVPQRGDPSSRVPIRLIELSVALADDRPIVSLSAYGSGSPKAGYWMRALRHADEDPKAPDAKFRFAAVTFPSDYPKSGRFTYVIDENNTIYARDLGRPGGLDLYPTEEELKLQWKKVD
jgi:hypothetical protein